MNDCIVFVLAALLVIFAGARGQETQSGVCEDNENYRSGSGCSAFKAAGFCKKIHKFRKFMLRNCRQTCALCPKSDRLILSDQSAVFSRKLTKCQQLREDAYTVIGGQKKLRLGAYLPRCEQDGSYSKKQCHESINYCWCVDKDGNKKPGRTGGNLNCDDSESKCIITDCVKCKDAKTCAECKPGYYKHFSQYGKRTLCRSNCGFFLYPSKNEKGELICINKPRVNPCPIDNCVQCKDGTTCAKCKPNYYKQFSEYGNKTLCKADCGVFLYPSTNENGELVCAKKPTVSPCPIDDCVQCKDLSTCAKCKPNYYKQFSEYGKKTLCTADCGVFLYPSTNENGELVCAKKPTGECPINDCVYCTNPRTCAKCKTGFHKHFFYYDNKRTYCTATCGSYLQSSRNDKGELVCVDKPKQQCFITDCEKCKDESSCEVCKKGTYKYLSPYGSRTICNTDCFGDLERHVDQDGHAACRKRQDADGCADSWCLRCKKSYLLYRKNYLRSFCVKQCPSGYVATDNGFRSECKTDTQ